ncbi:MAG: hypothetical protein OXB95_05190, partial [Rhodobacteraceae bacterium]|nr:hypothetical protein [Paracoccaceae bacterium]
DEYIAQKKWKNARLKKCPKHPEGGCGFARHGAYRRKHNGEYALIVRCHCPKAHRTWSLRVLGELGCARLSRWTGYHCKPGPVVMLRGQYKLRVIQIGYDMAGLG